MTRGARVGAAAACWAVAFVSWDARAELAPSTPGDGAAGSIATEAARGAEPGVQTEQAFDVGDWEIAPHGELRVRAEYSRNPVAIGGDSFEWSAVQGDGYTSAAPAVLARGDAVSNLWVASQRVRVGARIAHGTVAAVVTVQDARVLGWLPGSAPDEPRPGSGIFEPYRAYVELTDDEEAPFVVARIGRQPIVWGEGRLLGDRDWDPRGAALDAARIRFFLGDQLAEIELFAAMLAMPGPVPYPHADTATEPDGANPDDSPTGAANSREGGGAQLVGLANRWEFSPLFKIELAALARLAREPLPRGLVRGDTYTVDLRALGTSRGFSYAVEAALQAGRVANFGRNRELLAGAGAARLDWQTALPLAMRFGAQLSYASGDDSGGAGERLQRFDPILPNVREHHGMLDLVGWSNAFNAGGEIGLTPARGLGVAVRYALLGLAEPNDRWSSGGLAPIGVAPLNASRILGNEVDLRVAYEPWDGVGFSTGYGVLVTGDGARAVLDTAGRGSPRLLHFAYVQTAIRR
ncbi:MAG: hypothetical protein EXR75_02040 [Myxococcales bacterium]|nr:hypothetical protein [Myxococcales bacterium]